MNRLKQLFGNDFTMKPLDKKITIPNVSLSPKGLFILDQVHQKLILKAYSPHTVKSYRSALIPFLTFFDAREIEEGWKTGYIPLRRTTPYAQPVSKNNEGVIARLDSSLVQWAYNLTKDIELPDNEEIKGITPTKTSLGKLSCKSFLVISIFFS